MGKKKQMKIITIIIISMEEAKIFLEVEINSLIVKVSI